MCKQKRAKYLRYPAMRDEAQQMTVLLCSAGKIPYLGANNLWKIFILFGF